MANSSGNPEVLVYKIECKTSNYPKLVRERNTNSFMTATMLINCMITLARRDGQDCCRGSCSCRSGFEGGRRGLECHQRLQEVLRHLCYCGLNNPFCIRCVGSFGYTWAAAAKKESRQGAHEKKDHDFVSLHRDNFTLLRFSPFLNVINFCLDWKRKILKSILKKDEMLPCEFLKILEFLKIIVILIYVVTYIHLKFSFIFVLVLS